MLSFSCRMLKAWQLFTSTPLKHRSLHSSSFAASSCLDSISLIVHVFDSVPDLSVGERRRHGSLGFNAGAIKAN